MKALPPSHSLLKVLLSILVSWASTGGQVANASLAKRIGSE